MLRRLAGVLALGISVSAVLALTVDASTTIAINSATVPGHANKSIVVHITYACDAASGVKNLDLQATDTASSARGNAHQPASCDGVSRAADVTVDTITRALYNGGDQVRIRASFADAGDKPVGNVSQERVVTAQ
ncbi:MAG TPA: hypothetical protein VGL20_09805 [Candidatus Dormibacteraeota bacterium]